MTENTNPEADLEKARDEKCIPIAREMMNDMATMLLPENANEKIDFNPIVLSFLKRGLEADLNISTEVSYLFQLLLGALSGLNKSVQSAVTIPIDDVRYGAIGKKILGFLAEGNVTLGSVTPEQTTADFAPVMEKINALFAEEKLSMLEVKYIMDNIFASFNTVNNMFTESLEASSAKAEAALFGVESMSDITMSKLDSTLKKLWDAQNKPETIPAAE